MVRNKSKVVIINKESKGYLAKLLATENITIQHKKVKTAYFDVKNRVLCLPIWKNMGNDVIDLLISHEVGHALFTPSDGWSKAIDKGIQHSFLNVIEDARIEKLIKRKYPGLRQSFIKGYKELISNNFFGTKEKDVNNMLLIDRLNIHFKSSIVESIVKFENKKEKDIVKRMEDLETFDDVVKLAEELGSYCKSEMQTKGISQLQVGNTDDEEDSEPYDSDQMREAEGDGSSEGQKEKESEEEKEEDSNEGSASGDDEEDKKEEDKKEEENKSLGDNRGQQSTEQEQSWDKNEPVAETDNSWESQKGDLLDKSVRENQYFYIHEFKNHKDFTVDYKIVLSDFRKYHNKFFYGTDDKGKRWENKDRIIAWTKLVADYKLFKRDSSKAVSYMVKEFEMKKAATAYRRAQTSNSGVVDPLKLHSYKFNNDIFKRLTVLPDGKNHGLMMFIDWSGSMSDKLFDTIKQLMNLTMFCKKVSIPFEVYAFNNGRWDKEKHTGAKVNYQDNDLSVDESFRMLNFISSRMNAKEYEQGMTNLYALGKSREQSNYNYYGSRFRHQTAEQIEEANMWSNLPNSPQGYGLSSTPLNDTIMAAMKMVKEFQLKYNIDKMNTVFLTDGASDGNERVVCLNPTEEQKKSRRYRNEEEKGYCIQGLDFDTNHIMVDRETKHQYFNDHNRDDMTENLLKALRVKTGSKVIGFYISARKQIDRYTLDKYFPEWNRWSDKKKKLFNRREIMAKYRKDKVLVVKDNTGYDEYYLLAGDDLQVEDGQMATPSTNAKKGEIKKLFAQNLKSNRQSRVVMNKFISQVA